MSNLFSIKDAEKKIAEVSIPAMATHHIKEHKQGFNKLSRLLGKPPGYIAQQLKRKNPSLPLLYALSVHLQTNFFEPFCNLLPENIRPTRQEKALQQQLTDLQKQYDDLKKERDLLKEIVMK